MPPVLLAETDGAALTRIRVNRGYSRRVLGEKVGVSREMIRAIETGKVNATVVMIDRLASALDVDVSCLRYTGPKTLAERATVPSSRRHAAAAQYARELRAEKARERLDAEPVRVAS